MLFVPATSERFFAKAIHSDADGIIFDLEDSVAEGQKDSARKTLVSVLNDLDFGIKAIAVRINGVQSPYMYRDVIALAEHCPRLDFLVQPMVESAHHLKFASILLDQIQRSKANVRRSVSRQSLRRLWVSKTCVRLPRLRRACRS